MVGIAVLAALVVVLQLLSSVIKIGTVSITLTLIPIVVGAAFYGPGAGAILGTVFGLVVYINSPYISSQVQSSPGTSICSFARRDLLTNKRTGTVS